MSAKLKIKQAILVEGKYDKIKLQQLVDAPIFTTDGFSVFSSGQKAKLLRRLALSDGLIILTDSDPAGFVIRNKLKGMLPKEKVVHIYAPQISGKEKRKKEPSKEGKIGVEGINDDVLLNLFKKANISSQPIVINNPLTSVDMFTLELSGTPNAKQNKKKLLKSLDLPEFLSTSSLISYINSSMTKDEFYKYCDNLFTNL